MVGLRMVGLATLLAVMLGASLEGRPEAARPLAPLHPFDGSLSILTYNVEGLPWPVARGRSEALDQIAARLREMHRLGEAPQVAVLQEAFTSKAQSIGRASGYRFIASGPGASEIGTADPASADRQFLSGARWSKGETSGKLVGSGLQILSDFPIRAVSRLAFPDFACAGFDCLANKGVLLVTIDIPGARSPLQVVATHLNSRTASGVPDGRSDHAYWRQVGILTRFIRHAHDPQLPLVVAGDFNVGAQADRREALLADARAHWVPTEIVSDALGRLSASGGRLSSDAEYARRRAKDWQFYSSGSLARLELSGISVPFGRTGMLSDHVGYVARYRLDSSKVLAVPVTHHATARA